jgi:succinate dehydrogenase / fumarate reductase, cytochrome b subunit
MSILQAFQSSIGRKFVMGLTGLFLVTFLVVHVGINSMIFFNDGGKTFNEYATFMSHNWIIRVMEVGLFVGFIVHIIQGFTLTMKNQKARPSKYAVSAGNATSKWYSRSMGVLGSLLLIFLAVHLSHFWLGTKASLYLHGDAPHDTFKELCGAFSNVWIVVLYVGGVVALWWHLIHGIPSAFQTLGINNAKYNGIIKNFGYGFATLVCILFAAMPIVIKLGIIQELV